MAAPQGLPDALMAKYIGGAQISVPITPKLSVLVEMGSLAATLVLVECYQDRGRLDEAIGLVQQVRAVAPHKALTVVSVSCSPCSPSGMRSSTSRPARSTPTTSIYRSSSTMAARSRTWVGMMPLVVYREALKSTKRDSELLWWARYRRAGVQLRLGSKARAKADFARIYAENPHYADVTQQLADLSA